MLFNRPGPPIRNARSNRKDPPTKGHASKSTRTAADTRKKSEAKGSGKREPKKDGSKKEDDKEEKVKLRKSNLHPSFLMAVIYIG